MNKVATAVNVEKEVLDKELPQSVLDEFANGKGDDDE